MKTHTVWHKPVRAMTQTAEGWYQSSEGKNVVAKPAGMENKMIETCILVQKTTL